LAVVLSVLLRYTDSDYLPLVSSNSSSFNKANISTENVKRLCGIKELYIKIYINW
jgi:hypothetical protein